jgi:hypothetical protein
MSGVQGPLVLEADTNATMEDTILKRTLLKALVGTAIAATLVPAAIAQDSVKFGLQRHARA